jgi:chemotaxis protein CheD
MSSALPIATNLYFDNHFKRPGVKLLPNEFYTTNEDMVLVTVLGSCVAACIQDRTAGIGGMNHFMLPDDGADVGQAASERTFRSQGVRRRRGARWHDDDEYR